MGQGISDPDIVAIKRHANEDVVTYLRIKHAENDSDKVVKGEGKDMLTRKIYTIGTVITRSEDNLLRRHPRKDKPNQERSKK